MDYSEAISRMVDSHRSRLVDGFILDKTSFGTDSVTELHCKGVPVVVTNGSPVATTETGEHLLSLAHRRVALVTRTYSSFPNNWRPWHISNLRTGFQAAFEKLNIQNDPELVFEAEPSDILGVISVVERMLSLPDPPTALFAADDALAVAIINALHRRGMDVPRDMSVIGYGDWSPAVYLSLCPLSTIRCPLRESGQLAMRLLIDILEGRQPKERQILLPTELICRSSTTPLIR